MGYVLIALDEEERAQEAFECVFSTQSCAVLVFAEKPRVVFEGCSKLRVALPMTHSERSCAPMNYYRSHSSAHDVQNSHQVQLHSLVLDINGDMIRA
jgi:hypothetical protein